jgi:hypothetical protein
MIAGLAVACGNPTGLAAPTIANVVDTVALGALTRTPLTVPSGFQLETSHAVFTSEVPNFDFAYDVDASGRPVFLPAAVIGLVDTASFKPGLLQTTQPFDSMTQAPTDGYVTLDPIPVQVGDRFYVRSGLLISCNSGLPFYGKLEVLAIDSSAYTIEFRALIDRNCGYHALVPGLPPN